MRVLSTVVTAAALLCSTPTLADDWVADKLHGRVFVFFHGAWVALNRGDIIADSAVIRTGADGGVRFTRDHETIDLAADTQIQIFDRTGQRYTVVREAQGAVSVEANVENVKHFEVRTPYVAAVVKGTIFSVMTAGKGSMVETFRGDVGVTSARTAQRVDVPAGHMAAVSATHGMAAMRAPTRVAASGAKPKWPVAIADVLSALPPTDEPGAQPPESEPAPSAPIQAPQVPQMAAAQPAAQKAAAPMTLEAADPEAKAGGNDGGGNGNGNGGGNGKGNGNGNPGGRPL